jgi:two-component system, OmpR family, sensor histidine kinase CiaH
MNIIRSAVVQLTLWYLVLIMVLSIGFSLVLYHLSGNEIYHGLRRQGIYLNSRLLPSRFDNVHDFRQYQLELELGHLRSNLFLFNLAALAFGAAASYALARRTLQPIEEAMNRQSRFTADASHELRTPLTAMQTEIEVALRDPALTKQQAKELLSSNLEEVAKLRTLSDGLLRLAQQDGKNMTKELVDLEGVVKEACERVARAVKAKGVDLDLKLSKVVVRGDKQSLIELVSILLDNAIKYSPEGGNVFAGVKRIGKQAVITISDEGLGIEASDLPHIFDRFYRADLSRSKTQVEGYGLGLSIAQQIIDLHQGTIEVKSTPGKGSSFIIKLPATG